MEKHNGMVLEKDNPGTSRNKRMAKRKSTLSWIPEAGTTEISMFQTDEDNSCCYDLLSPYDYFKNFVTVEFLDIFVDQSTKECE